MDYAIRYREGTTDAEVGAFGDAEEALAWARSWTRKYPEVRDTLVLVERPTGLRIVARYDPDSGAWVSTSRTA